MFGKFTGLFTAWRQQRIALRKLRQMNDHLLQDLGTSREAIEDFVRQRAAMIAQGKGPPSQATPGPGASDLDLIDTDRRGAAVAEAELGGGGFGKIDDASPMEGAAIVDDHLNRSAGALVDDAQLGAEGQRSMRGRHGILVEDLS